MKEISSPWSQTVKKVVGNLSFLILLATLLGFMFPKVADAKQCLIPLLMVIVFNASLVVRMEEVRKAFNLKAVICGVMLQYFVVPFISVLIVSCVLNEYDLIVGVAIATAVPCSISLPYITSEMRGDVLQSFSLSTVSTLTSPIFTPLVISLLVGAIVEIDSIGIIVSVIELLIVPLMLARLVDKALEKDAVTRLRSFLALPSRLIFAFAVWVIIGYGYPYITSKPVAFLFMFVATAVILALAFLIGYYVGHLIGGKKTGVLLMMASGYRTNALAIALALTYFSYASVVPVCSFTVVENIFLALVMQIQVRT